MNRRYLVRTLLGDMVVEGDVYTRADNAHSLRINPWDLGQGGMIAYPAHHVISDLSKVERDLRDDPRYVMAENMIVDINPVGDKIPKLRQFLIDALHQKGVIGGDQSEVWQKIMRENGQDFTRDEYEQMEGHLKRIFAGHPELSVGEYAMGCWLRGESRAPYEFSEKGGKMLEILGADLNPALSSWKYGEWSPTSQYFNYRLYNAVRQQVVRFIHRCQGITTSDRRGEGGDRIIRVTPEFGNIFSRFFTDVPGNPDLKYTKVIGVEELKPGAQTEGQNAALVVKDHRDVQDAFSSCRSTLTSALRQFSQVELLKGYYLAMIEDYAPLDLLNITSGADRAGFHDFASKKRSEFGRSALPFLLKRFGLPMDADVDFLTKEMEKEYAPNRLEDYGIRYMAVIDNVMRSLLIGKVDEYFHFNRGTGLRLLESLHDARKSLPKTLFEYLRLIERYKNIMCYETPNPDKFKMRRLFDQSRDARTLLERDYGISFQGLGGSPFHYIPRECEMGMTSVIVPEKDPLEVGPNLTIEVHGTKFLPRRYVELCRADRPSMELMVSIVPAHVRLMGKKIASEMLGNLGLDEIFDLRRQDYYWEDMGIDPKTAGSHWRVKGAPAKSVSAVLERLSDFPGLAMEVDPEYERASQAMNRYLEIEMTKRKR